MRLLLRSAVLGGIIFSICIFPACSDDAQPEEKVIGTYSQDFKTNIAYLVLERNGRPHILASGYLADREKGIFYTAKHFTDEFRSLGTDSCKLFFNGKVYIAMLIRVPPTRDAAMLRISSYFNPDEFPGPAVAKSVPKIGDKMYIRGFHPHAYRIREENKKEGFPDKVIPILKEYYGYETKDLTKESQIVFDNLEGRRIKIDQESVRNSEVLTDEEKNGQLQFENDSYIKVFMKRDHKFSFGGLSGGLAVNDNEEVVGVITAQDIYRFEYDRRGLFIDPNNYVTIFTEKKHMFDTIYVTPIDSLKELEEYMGNLR